MGAHVQLHVKGIVVRDVMQGVEIKAKIQQIARTGEFLVMEKDAKVGGFGIVPSELDGAIVSGHYFLFEIDEKTCLQSWLDWLIRWGALEEQVTACGSTNYAAIRPNDVVEFTIPLPPLAKQRRIVARVDALARRVEEARSLRRAAGEEVEALWISSLKQVFTPKSEQSETIESVCETITDNPNSTPKYDGDESPYIRSQDIDWGEMSFANCLRTSYEEFIERTRRGEPQTDDIAFVCEGGIGRRAIVDGTRRFGLGQRVMMLRPNQERVISKFLMSQLMSPPVLQDQRLTSKTGTTSQHLNIGRFKKILIKQAPLADQRHIVAYLDGLQAKVDELRRLQAATHKELDALMPSVLAKAFAGEL